MNTNVTQALKVLIDKYPDIGCDSFMADLDPEWRSPCEIAEKDDKTRWYPCLQENPVSFAGLANAVDAPIHPDICSYYGSYWSGTLPSASEEGHVSLIQLWNPEDFDRLVANLIGHYMMTQKNRQPFTLFFANTEPESEYFLSVHNSTGEILLEEPATGPIRVVEADLATFLTRLTPVNSPPGIY